MKALRIIPFFYLLIGCFFIYDGITKIGIDDKFWLSFVIAAVAIFMFFFRRKYSKRMVDHYNKD